ncbi:FMN-binding protein [Peptoniphilus equinus]|uniref:Ion-translocating oxidoreductase complex subunit G n=1 Tax=Peptoniphilus equinus TaxID=3016343 RepID=A0ABY7QUU0_9FIRM|nr:FMN-binding protein [Peptoniphilus equinus]WBW50557.1 FMN-binding protein [Peptoniphilus equinus]
MKEPIKFGLILLMFCAISAGLLAFVNGQTADVIAKAQLQATLDSYETIFGDEADGFEVYDETKLAALQATYPEVDAVFVATKGGQPIGYGINFIAGGYGGNMTNAIGIKREGDQILGFRNIVNAETKGFGTQIQDEPYYTSYEGKSAAGELTISTNPQAETEILQISGATVTSKGVARGVNIALQAYNNVLKSE